MNGAERQLEGTVRLAELQEITGTASSDGIAVAVNGEVVPRTTWKEREVRNGDDIEIVRAVQGG